MIIKEDFEEIRKEIYKNTSKKWGCVRRAIDDDLRKDFDKDLVTLQPTILAYSCVSSKDDKLFQKICRLQKVLDDHYGLILKVEFQHDETLTEAKIATIIRRLRFNEDMYKEAVEYIIRGYHWNDALLRDRWTTAISLMTNHHMSMAKAYEYLMDLRAKEFVDDPRYTK